MDRTDDTTAISALLDGLVDAWDRGDGTAYGTAFTADASYVAYVGTVYHGGAEIGRAHQVLFNSFLKGTRLASQITNIRFYGTDLAVVLTRGDTYRASCGRSRRSPRYGKAMAGRRSRRSRTRRGDR
ncbi:MAG TPA: SgcJ/EcaC family oxidoreductase [Actinomycetes bacterium]